MDLGERMALKLVGQRKIIDDIESYVNMHLAGLSPEGRPAGVFLALGPTGSGKTRTVEVLAEVLHGNPRNMIRVDCGEFQADHEVAKLIGAPPGYLGHRETQPILTNQKLAAAASEKCGLSIVLFDEIEKSAAAMMRILLGVLDKGTLRIGDNSTVNFERAMIFMTSNLGAQEMHERMGLGFGLEGATRTRRSLRESEYRSIGERAMKRKFSPEFINRIDKVLVYAHLTRESMKEILRLEIDAVRNLIQNRLAERAFGLVVSERASEWLLDRGFSEEFGARNLKRLIHNQIVQPLSRLLIKNQIPPDSCVRVEVGSAEPTLTVTR